MTRQYHNLKRILLIFLLSIIQVFSDIAFFSHAYTHLSPHLDVIHNILKEDRFVAILVDSLIEKAGVLENSINVNNVIQQLIPSSETITNTLTAQSQILSSTLNNQITPLYSNIETVVSTQKDALQDITTQSVQQLSLLTPKLYDLSDQTISTFSTATSKIKDIPLNELYESNILSKYSQISNQLIESFYKILENDPRLKLNTNEYINLVIQDDIKPKVQSALLSIYDHFIETDPRLKLSTSEYVKLAIQDDIQPKIQSTLDFLNRSPLAENIRSTLTRPTDEVVYDVSQTIAQKLSPVTDVLSTITNRLVQKVSEPVVSITQNIGNSFDSVLDTLSQQIITTNNNGNTLIDITNINSATDSILSSVTNTLPTATQFNEKIIESIESITNQIYPRLVLASNTFGSEFAKSGDKLNGNVGVLLDTTGNTLTILGRNMATTPEKIIDFFVNLPTTRANFISTSSSSSSTNDLFDTTTGTLTSSSRITAKDYIQPLLHTINDITEKTKNWHFFTDENHWQNGYWEQQISKIFKTVQELNEEKITTWGKELQITLDQAGQRFLEKSEKPIEKLDILMKSINTLNANIEPNIQLFQSKFQQGLMGIENNWHVYENEWNGFQKQLPRNMDEINRLLPSITLPDILSLSTITSSSISNSIIDSSSSSSNIVNTNILSHTSSSSLLSSSVSSSSSVQLPSSSSSSSSLLHMKQGISSAVQSVLADLQSYSQMMINEGDL